MFDLLESEIYYLLAKNLGRGLLCAVGLVIYTQSSRAYVVIILLLEGIKPIT